MRILWLHIRLNSSKLFLLSIFTGTIVNKKIFAAIGIALAIGILAVLLGSSSQDLPVAKNEKLGLIINTPSSAVTLDQLTRVYSEASATGIGRNNLYLFWNNIEPQPDQYNWRDA